MFKFILFLFYATSGYAQTSYFETSTPEAQGISSLNILKFIDRLETEIDAVHSFMIIRNGKLVSSFTAEKKDGSDKEIDAKIVGEFIPTDIPHTTADSINVV